MIDLLVSQVLLGAPVSSVLDTWLSEQQIAPEVMQSFLMKDDLNEEIWTPSQTMRPKVRKQLLSIAQDFFKQLDVDKSVLDDITLTGSIANYNWSEYSDIDLHLRLDFDAIDENEKLVRNYMLAQKNLWNEKHDIEIGGFPVEVYVENVGDTHVASGLYSVLDNKWLVKPVARQLMVDLDDVKTKAQSYFSVLGHIEKYLAESKPKKALKVIESTKKKVKQLRAAGLETGGEFTVENLAFKTLRRSQFFNRLDELAQQAELQKAA